MLQNIGIINFRFIHQVLFWFRSDIMLDPATFEEIDITQIPDDEVFSSRGAFMKLATDAVIEYAKQFGSDSEELLH